MDFSFLLSERGRKIEEYANRASRDYNLRTSALEYVATLLLLRSEIAALDAVVGFLLDRAGRD